MADTSSRREAAEGHLAKEQWPVATEWHKWLWLVKLWNHVKSISVWKIEAVNTLWQKMQDIAFLRWEGNIAPDLLDCASRGMSSKSLNANRYLSWPADQTGQVWPGGFRWFRLCRKFRGHHCKSRRKAYATIDWLLNPTTENWSLARDGSTHLFRQVLGQTRWDFTEPQNR